MVGGQEHYKLHCTVSNHSHYQAITKYTKFLALLQSISGNLQQDANGYEETGFFDFRHIYSLNETWVWLIMSSN